MNYKDLQALLAQTTTPVGTPTAVPSNARPSVPSTDLQSIQNALPDNIASGAVSQVPDHTTASNIFNAALTGTDNWGTPTNGIPWTPVPKQVDNTGTGTNPNNTDNTNNTGTQNYSGNTNSYTLPGYIAGENMPPTNMQQLYQLRRAKADDRMNNTGAYYIDPNMRYSPDQISNIRNAADKLYGAQEDALTFGAQKDLYMKMHGVAGILSDVTPGSIDQLNRIRDTFSSENRDTINNLTTMKKSAVNANNVYSEIQNYTNQQQSVPAGKDVELMDAFIKATNPGVSIDTSKYATMQDYMVALPEKVKQRILQTGIFGNSLPTSGLNDDARKLIVGSIDRLYKEQVDTLYTPKRQQALNAIYNIVGNNPNADQIANMMVPNDITGYEPKIQNNTFDIQGFTNDAIKAGKSQEEINAYLKSKGHSFNTVGNTSDSTVIAGVNLKDYATKGTPADPNYKPGDTTHAQDVAKIFNNIPQLSNTSDYDRYIKSIAPSSPLTGNMIATASQTYQVDPKLILAIVQNDSTFGTKGKAVRTLNAGNVGNTDSGATHTYPSWDNGVMAVAKWLANHKQA